MDVWLDFELSAFDQIKLVKILQELTESEPKAYPKHQRDRWTNTSP